MPAYAELQVTSNFSFLRGASHPEELVATAAALGLHAIALTDRNSLAGIVRAHSAAKQFGIRFIVGAWLELEDAPSLLCLPTDRAAYGRLARLITIGRRRAPKDGCRLTLADVVAHREGQILIALPPGDLPAAFGTLLPHLHSRLQAPLYLAASHLYRGDDDRRIALLADLAAAHQIPLVATNDVHAHVATRRPLQDVLTCIRAHCTIHQAGYRLFANAERHLKAPTEMVRLFRRHPEAIAHTIAIAEACRFSLDDLRYEYPVDPVTADATPQQDLERLAWIGAEERYPEGVPDKVRTQIVHELSLIESLGFAPYFLTVHDIVRFTRERGILCQGRGSAANSAVCYCLGITAVDPSRIDVLFERFVSAARNEPPDIDVDFEHERREEVIQYVYRKYGRTRAGMTATVITYRAKSAVREVGKVMGLSQDSILALQRAFWRRHDITTDDIREAGLDPQDRIVRHVIDLAGQLLGFPRHLSQHTGGMVITNGPLIEVVPIANAAMADRTVIEWDKNDLDALGILKIDLLGLGMLTCIRKAFALIADHHRRPLSLAGVPAEDPAVYEMLCHADSIGVFQVESRAQMSMLPRLKPRCFYDLVIQVAIVRPGPIQGNMVHPYLRRRESGERVRFPSPELEAVLSRTCGVPLFQEQAMKIAIVAAGFTPAEADALRRAMATFRRYGTIHSFRDKFITGMDTHGYARDFAERCFQQIEGFADYGFPESHAASFALLVYVSAWLKCHYPVAFACALLNSQPMGFYAPAQIVADARRHGVDVRPVDVNLSDWDCILEPLPFAGRYDNSETGGEPRRFALRLGLSMVKGFPQREARAMIAARGTGYSDLAGLAHRSGLGRAALLSLARADAFTSLGLNRRDAVWAVQGLDKEPPLDLFAAAGLDAAPGLESSVRLPDAAPGEQITGDYRMLGLSLKGHPLALLRPRLQAQGYIASDRLPGIARGRQIRIAGIVTTRQRPGSANGVMFITIEDEAGQANIIVWPRLIERCRAVVLGARMLGVKGRVQREGEVIHIVAEHLADLTLLLETLAGEVNGERNDNTAFPVRSRDFH